MPALAEHFTVVAPHPRGMGTGYDAATLADDMAALMTELGHDRFAVVGYDLGMVVAYALAGGHRDRVTRFTGAESILPCVTPFPPMLTDPATNEVMSHFVINRLADLNERLTAGREEIYVGHQFATKTATPGAIPQDAVDLYVDHLRDPAARLRVLPRPRHHCGTRPALARPGTADHPGPRHRRPVQHRHHAR